jgi:hypothetical protein
VAFIVVVDVMHVEHETTTSPFPRIAAKNCRTGLKRTAARDNHGMADATSMGYGAMAEAMADTEDGIGGLGLPCRKTLRAWARSHFGKWSSHSSSEPYEITTEKSKFSGAHIVAWFEFKERKFLQSPLAVGSYTDLDREAFGCNKKYHKDAEFIAIFKKPVAEVGKNRKR